jgi:hypothetical protein
MIFDKLRPSSFRSILKPVVINLMSALVVHDWSNEFSPYINILFYDIITRIVLFIHVDITIDYFPQFVNKTLICIVISAVLIALDHYIGLIKNYTLIC